MNIFWRRKHYWTCCKLLQTSSSCFLVLLNRVTWSLIFFSWDYLALWESVQIPTLLRACLPPPVGIAFQQFFPLITHLGSLLDCSHKHKICPKLTLKNLPLKSTFPPLFHLLVLLCGKTPWNNYLQFLFSFSLLKPPLGISFIPFIPLKLLLSRSLMTYMRLNPTGSYYYSPLTWPYQQHLT